ncbi:DUF4280 domain-containing protein [Chryseobacterium rhizosphaerae]|uniref:DUF4280 domain-containing protein n=1 Tax=Chryseobacterium rhizosphaerae TaxID=395937 RepID=UPI00068A5F02|nr:DUF4280 domain-containing protein [Chryseobacterium rhizosphaerae]MDC8100429.1 DUF4280 domain-containing protein [Chryseobacterium rhizosphaerae]MDR6545680.1 hypothetical protein [Chryseobacterium rhizosphaerae]
MSDENKKYVPEGVFLVCDMGATPSQLIATPRKVNLYGPMMATDADNKFTVNILPFGACKKIGGPCVFASVEWTKTKSGNVFTNSQKPLLEDSEAICTIGQGKIKIFFDKYEADLANENNNESGFVSEEISSNIIGGILTSPFGSIVDLFCDDDKKFTEGVGRGFKQGLEGTWNFLTDDMWKGETWVGLGKMAVIGVAYSGPTGPLLGDTNLQAIDQVFGSDFKKTKDALVEGVGNTVNNAIEDVKRGETGEVGESVGQIYYAVVEAVVGSKGAGLVAKGLTTGAKALIGAERLASLSAKIAKFANALKQGMLSVVKVGKKIDPVTKRLIEIAEQAKKEAKLSPAQKASIQRSLDRAKNAKTPKEKAFHEMQASKKEQMYKGTQIDTRFKQLVENDPNLSHLETTGRGKFGPDVYDPKNKKYWDLTTEKDWEKGTHQKKYDEDFGEGNGVFWD